MTVTRNIHLAHRKLSPQGRTFSQRGQRGVKSAFEIKSEVSQIPVKVILFLVFRDLCWLLNNPKIEFQIPAVRSIKLNQIRGRNLIRPLVHHLFLLSWIRHGRSHSLIAFDHDRLTLFKSPKFVKIIHHRYSRFQNDNYLFNFSLSSFHDFSRLFRKIIIIKKNESNCGTGSIPEVDQKNKFLLWTCTLRIFWF